VIAGTTVVLRVDQTPLGFRLSLSRYVLQDGRAGWSRIRRRRLDRGRDYKREPSSRPACSDDHEPALNILDAVGRAASTFGRRRLLICLAARAVAKRADRFA